MMQKRKTKRKTKEKTKKKTKRKTKRKRKTKTKRKPRRLMLQNRKPKRKAKTKKRMQRRRRQPQRDSNTTREPGRRIGTGSGSKVRSQAGRKPTPRPLCHTKIVRATASQACCRLSQRTPRRLKLLQGRSTMTKPSQKLGTQSGSRVRYQAGRRPIPRQP